MEYTFDAVLHEIPENGGAYVMKQKDRPLLKDVIIISGSEYRTETGGTREF